MLLSILNLPINATYADVKKLVKERCDLSDIIVDNLVIVGNAKKVTIGVADEDDAAIIIHNINGIYFRGKQLRVEDNKKKQKSEIPYQSSNKFGNPQEKQQFTQNQVQYPQSVQQNQQPEAQMGYSSVGNNANIQQNMAMQTMMQQQYMYGNTAYQQYGMMNGMYYMPQVQDPSMLGYQNQGTIQQGYVTMAMQDGYTQQQPVAGYNTANNVTENTPVQESRFGQSERDDLRNPKSRSPVRQQNREIEKPKWGDNRSISSVSAKQSPWGKPDEPHVRSRSPHNRSFNKPGGTFDSQQTSRDSYNARNDRADVPFGSRSDYTDPRNSRSDYTDPRNSRSNWDAHNAQKRHFNASASSEPKYRDSQLGRDDRNTRNNRDVDQWKKPEDDVFVPNKRFRPDEESTGRRIRKSSGSGNQRGMPQDHRSFRQDQTGPKDQRSSNDHRNWDDNQRKSQQNQWQQDEMNVRNRYNPTQSGRPNLDLSKKSWEPPQKEINIQKSFGSSQYGRSHSNEDQPSKHKWVNSQIERNDRGSSNLGGGPANYRWGQSQHERSRSQDEWAPPQNEIVQNTNNYNNERDTPKQYGSEQSRRGRPNQGSSTYKLGPPNDRRRTELEPTKSARSSNEMPYKSKGFEKPIKPLFPQKSTVSNNSLQSPSKKLTPAEARKIQNRNECFRLQVASKIGNEIVSIHPLENEKGINGIILKTLKRAIKSRIDVLLGETVMETQEEIVDVYRKSFHRSGDLRFLESIIELVQQGDCKGLVASTDNSSTFTKDVSIESEPNSSNVPVASRPPAPKLKKPKGPACLPQTSDKDLKALKRARKGEVINYELNPTIQAALNREISCIVNVALEELHNPKTEGDKKICNDFKVKSVPKLKKQINQLVASRILNITNHLIVRVFYPRNQERKTVEKLLASHGVTSMKKSKKATMMVANCGTFRSYDALCSLGSTVFEGVKIDIKPFQISGSPMKMTRELIHTENGRRVNTHLQLSRELIQKINPAYTEFTKKGRTICEAELGHGQLNPESENIDENIDCDVACQDQGQDFAEDVRDDNKIDIAQTEYIDDNINVACQDQAQNFAEDVRDDNKIDIAQTEYIDDNVDVACQDQAQDFAEDVRDAKDDIADGADVIQEVIDLDDDVTEVPACQLENIDLTDVADDDLVDF